MRILRRVLALAALVPVVGCGGDDGDGLSDADQALADALTEKFDGDDEVGFGEVFDTACMGRGIVVALGGAAEIEATYGITADDVAMVDETPLERADADAVVAAYEECGDFREVLVLGFTESGVPADLATCVAERLDAATITDSLVENFVLPSAESGPANTRLAEEASIASVECSEE